MHHCIPCHWNGELSECLHICASFRPQAHQTRSKIGRTNPIVVTGLFTLQATSNARCNKQQNGTWLHFYRVASCIASSVHGALRLSCGPFCCGVNVCETNSANLHRSLKWKFHVHRTGNCLQPLPFVGRATERDGRSLSPLAEATLSVDGRSVISTLVGARLLGCSFSTRFFLQEFSRKATPEKSCQKSYPLQDFCSINTRYHKNFCFILRALCKSNGL